MVAGKIAPIFVPLGFADWRISTSLITGFMAKESVVATIGVLFGGTESLVSLLTTADALSLLVFCLLYTPCVASIAAVRREQGGKFALGMVFWQLAIAWIVAWIVRMICMMVGMA